MCILQNITKHALKNRARQFTLQDYNVAKLDHMQFVGLYTALLGLAIIQRCQYIYTQTLLSDKLELLYYAS